MKEILQYHNKLIDAQGVQHATGFSRNGQTARFDVIRSLLEGENISVLDYGCNVGGFLKHLISGMLSKKFSYKSISYLGVDINYEFILQARRNWKDSLFQQGDILDDQFFRHMKAFEYVIASGIFCYEVGENPRQRNREIISRLWAKTERTLIFNMLKSSKTKNLLYKPEDMVGELNFIKYSKIQLIENYLPNDFTVVLKR